MPICGSETENRYGEIYCTDNKCPCCVESRGSYVDTHTLCEYEYDKVNAYNRRVAKLEEERGLSKSDET